MVAEVLLADAKTDTVGESLTIRIIGTQIPPVKMSIQIAITGTAKVQIQGRVHRQAPWVDIGDISEKSCLMYIEPILSLRAVSTGTGPDSSVSVWAAWGV
ncbi:MAG: hypothetical protein ABUS47_09915 [Steroidobacter sp.]